LTVLEGETRVRPVRWVVAAIPVAVVLALAPTAMAQSVPGGHYRFPTTGNDPEPPILVDVRLANDGREFAKNSWIGVAQHCRDGDGSASNVGVQLEDGPREDGRAVQIGPQGSFGFEQRGYLGPGTFVALRGRFAGHTVGGSIVVRQRGCGDVMASFRAKLVGRPGVTPPGKVAACDAVTVASRAAGDEVYKVRAHRLGCTRARALARGWHRSPECIALVVGATCRVAGVVCRAIHGGRHLSVAGARCALSRHVSAEFAHQLPCRGPEDARMSLWAINLDCTTAASFPIDTLVPPDESDGACGDVDLAFLERPTTCRSVAGFTCRVRDSSRGASNGFHALCPADSDPFRAIEFDYRFD
jgi:hypothetical protein